MTISKSPFRRRLDGLRKALMVPVLSMLATLLSLPANAGITLPTDPLTTASRVPPNIMFILDDSGSMAFEDLANPQISQICRRDSNGAACLTNNRQVVFDITDSTYVGNTIYYNPSINYQPWITSTGALMAGGTSYSAAYGDFNRAGGTTIDLANSASCSNFDRNGNADGTGANQRVCGGVQTFFVPKDLNNSGINYLANANNYYRYQISDANTVTRSEFGAVTTTSSSVAGYPVYNAVTTNEVDSYTISVPANGVLSATLNATGTRQAILRVRNAVSTSNDCNQAVPANSSFTCSVTPASDSTYVVQVLRGNGTGSATYSLAATITQNNRCSSGSTDSNDWVNCSSATPTGKNSSSEATNYATWFSYHRTRIKAAKAGAGQAFSDLGGNVRVGFRTIWSRNNLDIPVNDGNQGLFMDKAASGGAAAIAARTNWYNRLYNASGYNGTPLLNALDGVGQYFQGSSSTGPYGPEAGVDQYACRQNFAIMTTDGYWNGATAVNPGNQDGTNGTTYSGPGGVPAPYGYTASTPYSDSYSNTLADVAMSYWKSDLRSDLDNIVPTSNADPAFWQHMVTFGIAIGARGVLDPATDLARLVAGTIGWPDPQPTYTGGNDILARIDDLWHAAVNGRGTFLTAADPNAFKLGLTAALSTITQRTGSFSNVSATSTSLDGGTLVFTASYLSGVWTGELNAYPVVNSAVSGTPTWSASQGIPTSNRKIFTWNGVAGSTFPTATQTTSLARASAPAVAGDDNALYIAGNRSKELVNGGTLRNRTSLLGDIVSSSPAYSSDTGTVYVGANDGMLHAFNATNGVEQFAYIPSSINFADLGSLSAPTYSHRYFVDGPVILSTRAQTPDRTILVGSLGKGGKGVYALDVTTPSSFSASNVKWERYGASGDAEAANIGFIQSRPFVARLNDGTTALVVANGINSTNDQAVLLVYNLETGALLKQINTNVGSSSAPNGLSGATGWDADANGTVDYVYAGDVRGNVWKFDISGVTSGSWRVANTGSPIFTASYPVGTGSTLQPITADMTVALNPSTYETWLFFGTGRFMTTGDLTDKSGQSLYGIVDTATSASNTTLARTALTTRSITVTGTQNGFPVRAFQPNSILPAGSRGWYIDLLKPAAVTGGAGTLEGERIVSEAQLFNRTLLVSSIIPTASACQADGTGYINALDAFTGTSGTESFFDLDGDGSFSDETVGGLPVGSVNLGVGMPTLGNVLRGKIVVGGSKGSLGGVNIADNRNTGRVSWREIIRD
ncbi:PilC/PilY family type IV pilus protein [Xanthomonas hydrangeae]|uniref:PilC/PilY family type IV pilus protein n=1 Tax=Xanthomonas hydrangeae TaxID=2775159 RepID=A0AAU0B9M7_9XANT|nr:PilC/PilY family type IV pilus protein [Xanthomonas hydrangeae]WOB49785.1 PilC/PilY family type IV pilus protein [Xanthomonas hydrangeae]